MKWNYVVSLLLAFLLTIGVIAQDDMAFEPYASNDGRVAFDVPVGWLVTPFGPFTNLSTQGWVEPTLIEPGQQMIDIGLLSAVDLAAGGVARDLPPLEYAEAVLDTLGSEDDVFTIEESRVETLANDAEAGVYEISVGNSRVMIVVYQQDDTTVFFNVTAHASEYDDLVPVAMHVLSTIELGDNSAMAVDMPQLPVVNFVATDEGLEFPPVPEEGVPAGPYTFQFGNSRAEVPFSPMLARLNEGVTMEQFEEALNTDDGFGAVFLVTLLGGTEIVPDATRSITLELLPGEHLLMEFSPEGPGDVVPFTVIDNPDMMDFTPPVADVTFTLVDFAFGVPTPITAGETLWHIENAGEQWHEAVIVTVPEGTTIEDVIESASNEQPVDPDFESETAFFLAPMGAGQEIWTTLDLEPGTYAILCFLPDIAGDFSPHLMKGMVSVFTVE